MRAVDDIYEVVSTQSYLGSTVLNVFHLQVRAALSSASAAQTAFQTAADDFKEMQRVNQSSLLAYSTWKAFQVAGAGVTYSTSTCRRSGGDVYEGNHTGGLTGGNTTSAGTASYNALVSALKTGLSGRSRRGAIYMGGIPYTTLDTSNENQFLATYIALVVTQQAIFFNKYKQTGGTSADFQWVVWSKFIASGCKYVPASPKWIYTHVQPGDAVASAASVTSVTPRSLVVPMRRRKFGRGV